MSTHCTEDHLESDEILYVADFARRIRKTTEAFRSMRTRDPNCIPAPDGKIGRREYWLPETVNHWLKKGGNTAKKRGRPRLVPNHINIKSS